MPLLQTNDVAPELRRAETLALEFLERTKELRQRVSSDEQVARFGRFSGCKETAAVRRASLDLTRALAKMRKP